MHTYSLYVNNKDKFLFYTDGTILNKKNVKKLNAELKHSICIYSINISMGTPY